MLHICYTVVVCVSNIYVVYSVHCTCCRQFGYIQQRINMPSLPPHTLSWCGRPIDVYCGTFSNIRELQCCLCARLAFLIPIELAPCDIHRCGQKYDAIGIRTLYQICARFMVHRYLQYRRCVMCIETVYMYSVYSTVYQKKKPTIYTIHRCFIFVNRCVECFFVFC